MSRKKRKRTGSRRHSRGRQLSPAQRAFVRAFAEETVAASTGAIEAAVREALPMAIAVSQEEQPQRASRRRRKAVRDSRGRFLGWE
jgi:ribosomal protein S20